MGRDFVLRDAMITDLKKLKRTDVPINRVNIMISSYDIAGSNHCLKTIMKPQPAKIPMDTISRDAFTINLACPILPSEKLFPKKSVLPTPTCRSTICEKITLREISVELIPIMSDVVILVKRNHNRYPATVAIMLSIKRYVALLPTISLANMCHLLFHILSKIAIISFNNVD